MKQTICSCDRCGNETAFDSIRVVTGRSMDPSGNGYQDDVEMIDLCGMCLWYWTSKYHKITPDTFMEFVKEKRT